MRNSKKIVIQHPKAQFYQYFLGPRLDPGAQAEIFESHFTNPSLVFRGAGRVAGSMMVVQHPQVWYRQQVGVSGIGTQAGGVRFQPLIDLGTQ